ncbi:hypothetical protein FACS189490_13840 [Clostridia bacterium]|nr:hypothetical protein FACS189490_13840 [Clostridia bacterium]
MEIVKVNIKRDGINNLIRWLESTDFFTAPASTRFHGNYAGGLVEHSVNVYNNLLKLNDVYKLSDNPETLAIISLFHDVTKANCYKEDFRNVKNYNGKWEKVPC